MIYCNILSMKDTRISIRITKREHNLLKQYAKYNHTTINKYLTDYIRLNLNKNSYKEENFKNKIKILSLFCNIGIAEAYFNKINAKVVVANELIKKRADLYSKIYPDTYMVCGDILSDSIFNEIVNASKQRGVDILMATPPCQGMSTVGKKNEADVRNKLILPVIKMTKILKPKYVFIENVPMFLQTFIKYKNKKTLIIDVLKNELGCIYHFEINKADTKRYSVPQSRERAIILLSKKGLPIWKMPEPDKRIFTMRDAIGKLPSIDPFVKDVSDEERLQMFPDYERKKKVALKISPWNFPPEHIKRQVEIMIHTPTGQTAFNNKKFFPRKEDGTPTKGFKNTYKRQEWDIPAYTVTMDNRKISSQNNVHPGRFIKKDSEGEVYYSDPRALTIYELMKVMSIPDDWPIPTNTKPAFFRSVIGEGIPSLFAKKIFENNPMCGKKIN